MGECVRARSSPRVCLARVLARAAMEDDGDGDDASLRARSRRGVRATVAKRRRMDDSIDPSSLGVDVASASPSSARGGDASRAPRGRTAREIAATLGVSLPFDHREGDSAAAAAADDGVGACGAEAKTRADESEEEWNDVEDGRRRDYGACVPDVEPEERVTLEEDPAETTTTTKAKKSKTAARKKSRRLTDEERANLLATHHTHVMCVFARGMLVRAAASSALLRALVSSCAPPELARSVGAASSSSCSTIEVGTLARLVDWFADVIAPPICLDDEEEEEEDEKKKKTRVKDARWRRRAFGVALSRAGRGVDGGAARLAARLAHLWSKRGTVRMSEEASAALFAALCQGLGLSCRLVSSLEPTPIRASAAKLESIGALRSSKIPSVDADVRDAGDYARHWCEVLCARREENGETIPRWVCAAPTTRGSCDSPEIIFGNRKRTTTADASSSMPYVVAFYHDLGARDVTRKYALAFSQALHHRTPDWKWWEKITTFAERARRDAVARDCAPEMRTLLERADATEMFEMDARSSRERVPSTMTEIKNHPLWVVERFLTRSQCVHPRHPVKGLIAGEPVFPRSCVKELKSAERWKSECRRRVMDASLSAPVRAIHSRASQARVRGLARAREGWLMTQAEGSKERLENEEWRLTMLAREDCPEDPQSVPGDIALYGEWQTEPWTPPAAVGGLVPKNDYGNVDLYGNALPPPGTVHVNLPRVSKTAKSMHIDYAPALVGFEYKAGGKTLPVFNGVVVCEEFKDALLRKHEELEEARRLALEAKAFRDACLRWRLLLGAIWTRARLREEFQDGAVDDEDHTARRLAAAKAMNDASTDELRIVPTTAIEPMTLGADAYVEEL